MPDATCDARGTTHVCGAERHTDWMLLHAHSLPPQGCGGSDEKKKEDVVVEEKKEEAPAKDCEDCACDEEAAACEEEAACCEPEAPAADA